MSLPVFIHQDDCHFVATLVARQTYASPPRPVRKPWLKSRRSCKQEFSTVIWCSSKRLIKASRHSRENTATIRVLRRFVRISIWPVTLNPRNESLRLIH